MSSNGLPVAPVVDGVFHHKAPAFYVLPVVRNSYTPHWFVDYVRICLFRWAFRQGGCE